MYTSTTNQIHGDLPCIACGYNLRGVRVEGACPECGRSVDLSLLAMGRLTKRDIAALACKILALLLVLKSVWDLGEVVWYAAGALGFWSPPRPRTGWVSTAVHSSSPLVVASMLAAAFWWGSDWLAKRMVRQDGVVAGRGRLARHDLMIVAFSTLGLFLLATGIQNLAAVCMERFVAEGEIRAYWYRNLTGALAGTLIGFVLLIGSGGLVGLIRWLRTAGTRG